MNRSIWEPALMALGLAASLLIAPVTSLAQTKPITSASPQIRLWRLDCGEMQMKNFGLFADDFRFSGQSRLFVNSCYLIQHGSDYLLWDTGLSGDLATKPDPDGAFTIKRTIIQQLKQLGITPAQITYVGLSHFHFDHIGQLKDFPDATLLIGGEDFDYVKNEAPPQFDKSGFAPWLTGGAKVERVRDRDLFEDQSITILATPGHTPGHRVLLVRLPAKGAVLLSGDLFHVAESFDHDLVPFFNTNRADTLASIDRFKDIGSVLKATVIIQHEPRDVAKLPPFPKAAE